MAPEVVGVVPRLAVVALEVAGVVPRLAVVVLRFAIVVRRFAVVVPRFAVVVRRFAGMVRRFAVVVPRFAVVVPRFAGVVPRFAVMVRRFAVVVPRFAVVVPRFAVVVRRFAVVVPRFAVVVPRFAGMVPRFAVVVPRFAVVVPRFVGMVPRFAAVVPWLAAVVPWLAVMVPWLAVMVPRFAVVVPRFAGMVPWFAGMVPRFAIVVPRFAGAAPRFVGVVPRFAVMVPRFAVVVPHILGVVPRLAGVVPHIPGMVPRLASMVPRLVARVRRYVGVVPRFVGVVPQLAGVVGRMKTMPPTPRKIAKPGKAAHDTCAMRWYGCSRSNGMIERLKVNGYLSLVDAEILFKPLTVLLGRNGAGKSALLDALERLGSYARGGVDRAFGPPPYSLGYLRSRGYGDMPATSFEVDLGLDAERYRYRLALAERAGHAQVEEERLTRAPTGQVVAAWSYKARPTSGTILRPDIPNPLVERIAAHLKSVRIFDLDPRAIEQPSEDRDSVLSREGYGVGAYLGKLQEEDPGRFADIEERVRQLRPGTKGLRVWGGGAGKLYWGIEDQRGEDWRCPAPLLSWGDRVLVGILCVLFAAEAGSVVGLEEIDRGFHPARYQAVVDLLSEAAYKGMGGRGSIQILATSHSPALVSHFQDRLDELRLVSRAAGGMTTVASMDAEVRRRLGEERTGAPIGEVWAMGLLD